MKNKDFYNSNYFEYGKSLGICNYEYYRWIPEVSRQQAEYILTKAPICKNGRVLDFGCAKGFLVKIFRKLGYNSYGCDISTYAIENSDPEVRNFVRTNSIERPLPFERIFELITVMNVFEHIDAELLMGTKETLFNHANQMFIRVPIGINGNYNNPKHSQDESHEIAEDIDWWINALDVSGFMKTITPHYLPDRRIDVADFHFKRVKSLVEKRKLEEGRKS